MPANDSTAISIDDIIGSTSSDSTTSDSTAAPKRKYNYKVKTGRPFEYKECYPGKMLKFFREFRSDGTRVYPTVEDFSEYLGVSRQAMNEWRSTFEHFGDAFKQCLSIQSSYLQHGALSERFHPGFTKFLMINNHGMVSDNAVQQSNVNLSIPQGLNIRFIDSTRNT